MRGNVPNRDTGFEPRVYGSKKDASFHVIVLVGGSVHCYEGKAVCGASSLLCSSLYLVLWTLLFDYLSQAQC
jgi:hypothetical protein